MYPCWRNTLETISRCNVYDWCFVEVVMQGRCKSFNLSPLLFFGASVIGFLPSGMGGQKARIPANFHVPPLSGASGRDRRVVYVRERECRARRQLGDEPRVFCILKLAIARVTSSHTYSYRSGGGSTIRTKNCYQLYPICANLLCAPPACPDHALPPWKNYNLVAFDVFNCLPNGVVMKGCDWLRRVCRAVHFLPHLQITPEHELGFCKTRFSCTSILIPN